MSDDQSYCVGYCRPPQHAKWKKGQSGNPKGRPKRAASLGGLLDAMLSQRVTVTEGRRKKRVSRLEQLLGELVNQALKGDPRQAKLLLDSVRKEEERAAREPEPEETFGPADKKVMEALYARLARDAVQKAAEQAALEKPGDAKEENR
jgi:hypothetical protein